MSINYTKTDVQVVDNKQKARIVFDTIAGKQDAKRLPVSDLKFLLSTAGVANSEIDAVMNEIPPADSFTFEIFYERCPAVWDSYFAYLNFQN